MGVIRDRIVAACPYYREKFDISDGLYFNYYDDGRDLMFRFVNLNMDIPQWEILNSDTNGTIGNEVFFNSTTWKPYSSQNIFYEPVPYEFLYTNETQLQVLITVDGVEAACHSLQCGFNYIEAPSEVTGYSLSGNTLTITGTAFTNDIQSITLSNIACTEIQYVSDSELNCIIVPVAGLSMPLVIAKKGLIPCSVTDLIDVSLTVNDLTPNTDLNPFGGTYLTITGANLAQSLTDGT